MKNTVVTLEEAGLRNSVKIIVGGAPVTRAFADEIGADGYGYDSPGAAQRCKELVLGKIWTFAFEVEDLGINIIVEELVTKVAELKPDILGLSALLTTTMPEMKKKIIDALTESGLRDIVKVMVGGAPVNETYARQIGADGYAADAGESVDIAKELLK